MQSPTTRKKKELIEFITTHEVSNRDNSKNKLGRKPSVVLESEKLDNEFVIEIRIKYWTLQFLLKLFIKIYFIFLLTTRWGECIITKYFEYSFPKTASVIDIILQSQGLPRKWFVWTFFTLCFSRRKVYF